jgi:DNA-directed RNA polymerase subunit L
MMQQVHLRPVFYAYCTHHVTIAFKLIMFFANPDWCMEPYSPLIPSGAWSHTLTPPPLVHVLIPSPHLIWCMYSYPHPTSSGAWSHTLTPPHLVHDIQAQAHTAALVALRNSLEREHALYERAQEDLNARDAALQQQKGMGM